MKGWRLLLVVRVGGMLCGVKCWRGCIMLDFECVAVLWAHIRRHVLARLLLWSGLMYQQLVEV